jgi:uncharacterized phage protein gp47/JayE
MTLKRTSHKIGYREQVIGIRWKKIWMIWNKIEGQSDQVVILEDTVQLISIFHQTSHLLIIIDLQQAELSLRKAIQEALETVKQIQGLPPDISQMQ